MSAYYVPVPVLGWIHKGKQNTLSSALSPGQRYEIIYIYMYKL